MELVVQLMKTTLGFFLRFRVQRLLELLDFDRCRHTHRQSPSSLALSERFSKTRGPFLHRHYPTSSVLRPSPHPG